MTISIRDACSMFVGTLVKYKDEFVLVVDINERGLVSLFSLETGEVTSKKLDFMDFKPVTERLGYCNIIGHAVYLRRSPSRQHKFGLHSRVLTGNYTVHGTREAEIAYREAATFRNKEILKMFKGVYPKLKEALSLINSGWQVVAFDRQFAVTEEMQVAYKNDVVGRVKDGKILWRNGYEFLEKAIQGGQYEAA